MASSSSTTDLERCVHVVERRCACACRSLVYLRKTGWGDERGSQRLLKLLRQGEAPPTGASTGEWQEACQCVACVCVSARQACVSACTSASCAPPVLGRGLVEGEKAREHREEGDTNRPDVGSKAVVALARENLKGKEGESEMAASANGVSSSREQGARHERVVSAENRDKASASPRGSRACAGTAGVIE
eukprot:6204910-Pleurochrysis_carterae.AAC.6